VIEASQACACASRAEKPLGLSLKDFASMFAEGWRPRPRLYAVTAVLLLVHAAGVQARSNSKVRAAIALSVLYKFNTYTDLEHCLT
jgi:hypothetical protein